MDLVALRESLLAVITALQGVVDSLDEPDPEPVPDPEPEPIPSKGLAAVADLKPGEWVNFGRPWRDIDPGKTANCGVDFGKVLTAWCGLAPVGDMLIGWAGGGHGDGCNNSAIAYDLQAGLPVTLVPHEPLNVPLLWSFREGTDGWHNPYVSETPWADGTVLTKQQRLTRGPSIPAEEFRSEAEHFGAFLRPRASHNYNNLVYWQGWLYLLTGQIYGSGKMDCHVWRFDPLAKDPTSTIERLLDRWKEAVKDSYGGYSVSFVQPGDGRLLMFSGSEVFEPDFEAGLYPSKLSGFYISNKATLTWDGEFIWGVDPQMGRIFRAREIDGAWKTEASLDDARLDKKLIGNAGIAVVPGLGAYVRGLGEVVYHWSGEGLTEIKAPPGAGAVQNKWLYHAASGVLLGTWNIDEGIWAYRPVGGVKPDPIPDPIPDPEPEDPDLGVEFSTFAGHIAKPAPWLPANWDAPIERQPEAPDLYGNGLDWAKLEVRSDADAAQVKWDCQVIAKEGKNVRVLVHPGEYSEPIILDKIETVGEVIGMPDQDGKRPLMRADVVLAKIAAGMICRGLDFDGARPAAGSHASLLRAPEFLVLQDMRINGGLGGPWGTADPAMPLTYLEFRGVLCGPNTDWHTIYIERSIGHLNCLSSAFWGSNSDKHAFKNLAHRSRIEDSLFSNVGLDGLPLAQHKGGQDVVGMMPLDLYAPCESVFRKNTVIFRTSGNVRQCMAYRNRDAWSSNNKGKRLADGISRELWRPEDPSFLDESTWDEIGKAAQAFEQGYEAAQAEPWLFAHLNEGNTFIVIEAQKNGNGNPITDTRLAKVDTTRPIVNNLGTLMPTPPNWVERAGVYFGPNRFITCSGDIKEQAVTSTRRVDLYSNPDDPAVTKSPPRAYFDG